MSTMYISNIASLFFSTLGSVKGEAMVGEIKIGNGMERQGKRIEEYLVAKMWILACAYFLSGLAAMTYQSEAAQAKPLRVDPS